jgi:peptidoglycan/LPS O-acetylase OafA/YrhL
MGLAAILIANSHLESLYPKRWMAADGLLGNTIFFLLAGYGILLSQRQRPVPFGTFYWKRFIRIYPSFWIAMLLAAASGMMVNYGSDLSAWFSTWAWPTSFGFIGNIMVFYPVLWLLARGSDRIIQLFIVTLGLIWLGIWFSLVSQPSGQNLTLGQLPISLWWINFGLATALGAYIARKPLPESPSALRWAALAAAFLIYLLLKFELALRHFTTPAQLSSVLLAGPILLLATACAALLLLNLNSLNQLLGSLSPVSRPLSPVLRSPSSVLTWIGQASLQIYVLHMTVYHWVHLTNLPWPVQLILFALGTMIASRALLWLVNRVGRTA